MPSDKRAFEKDEAGAALELAKRPCPMSGDGEVKKKKGESISESALPRSHCPLILNAPPTRSRPSHAKQKASMLHSACSAHSRVS